MLEHLISTRSMLEITDRLGILLSTTDEHRAQMLQLATDVLHRVVGKEGTSYGVQDACVHQDIGMASQQMVDLFDQATFWRQVGYRLIAGLESNCSKYGVSAGIRDLDTYATYWNNSTAHSFTYSSSFAVFYWLYRNRQAMLSPDNVIATSVQLGLATVTANDTLLWTDGGTINRVSTVSAGVQGMAADNFVLQVVSGTLSGTIVATGYNQANATRTWTAVANNLSTGTVNFVPATTGDRIWDLTNLSYVGTTVGAVFAVKTKSRALL